MSVLADAVNQLTKRLRSSRGAQALGLLLSGTVATTIIGVISTVIISRSFSQAEVGAFFLASSWLTTFAMFGLPGLSSVIVSCVARGEGGTFRRAVRRESAVALAGTLCLFSVGILTYSGGPFEPWVYVAAGALYPFYLNDCGWQALTGRERYALSAIAQVACRLLTLAALVVCVVSDLSLAWYFLLGMVVMSATNSLLIALQWRTVGSPEKIDEESLRYGTNLTISNAILQPLGQAERLLVGLYFGPVELAIFGVGEMFFSYLKVVGGYTTSIYFPRVSRMPLAQVPAYLIAQARRWTYGFTLIAALLVFVLPWAYPLLFGESYQHSAYFAAAYALVFACGVPNYFLTIYFRHMRATRATYVYGLVRAPLQLGLLLVAFLCFGIVGLPIARLATVVAHCCLGMWLARSVVAGTRGECTSEGVSP